MGRDCLIAGRPQLTPLCWPIARAYPFVESRRNISFGYTDDGVRGQSSQHVDVARYRAPTSVAWRGSEETGQVHRLIRRLVELEGDYSDGTEVSRSSFHGHVEHGRAHLYSGIRL